MKKYRKPLEESDLQGDCNKYLDDNNIFYFHLEKGSQFNQKKHTIGFPDLIIWHKGKTYFVELKTEKGMMKKGQHEFMHKAVDNGFEYSIIRNLHQFVILMDIHGVIKY